MIKYTDKQKQTLAEYEQSLAALKKRQTVFATLVVVCGVIALFFIVFYLIHYFVEDNSVKGLLIPSIIFGILFIFFFIFWGYFASKRMALFARYENLLVQYQFINKNPEIFTEEANLDE